MIMSRDVSKVLYLNPSSSYLHEDVLISQILESKGLQLYNIQEYKWGFLIPFVDKLPDNI